MAKFRRKPVVVEAIQWFADGDHPMVIPDPTDNSKRVVLTDHGYAQVSPGDWILTGIKGEFYPCKEDTFYEIYESCGSE